MFRIGIFEFTLTCIIILLVLILPIMIKRIDTRLKNIEKRLNKKDK